MSGESREREEDASILGKKEEGEALRNIINKLFDERNLRDFHSSETLPHVYSAVNLDKNEGAHTQSVSQQLSKLSPFLPAFLSEIIFCICAQKYPKSKSIPRFVTSHVAGG